MAEIARAIEEGDKKIGVGAHPPSPRTVAMKALAAKESERDISHLPPVGSPVKKKPKHAAKRWEDQPESRSGWPSRAHLAGSQTSGLWFCVV